MDFRRSPPSDTKSLLESELPRIELETQDEKMKDDMSPIQPDCGTLENVLIWIEKNYVVSRPIIE